MTPNQGNDVIRSCNAVVTSWLNHQMNWYSLFQPYDFQITYNMCKFTYLLKFVTPKPILAVLSGHLWIHTFPAEAMLLPCCSSLTVNSVLFMGYLVSCFLFHFCAFCGWFPWHSAEVLSIPKHKKAVMCIKEKGYASDKLWSEMMYTAWVQC